MQGFGMNFLLPKIFPSYRLKIFLKIKKYDATGNEYFRNILCLSDGLKEGEELFLWENIIDLKSRIGISESEIKNNVHGYDPLFIAFQSFKTLSNFCMNAHLK